MSRSDRRQNERARTFPESLEPFVDPRTRVERLCEYDRQIAEQREIGSEVFIGLLDRWRLAEGLVIALDRVVEVAHGDDYAAHAAKFLGDRFPARINTLRARRLVFNQEREER